MQISDNPELFQPLVEDDIMAANAGEIINSKVWGEQVCLLPEGVRSLVCKDQRRSEISHVLHLALRKQTALQEPITPQNAGERLQTRCERETLSRFPKTGAILFTIRTHMRKLNTFEGRPDKVIITRSACGPP